MSLTIGSLCTDILGLDMAVAQHFGAELAWFSEIEPAAITVIERHHPEVPNLGDLKAIEWATVPAVDIFTAGYPCQPFSHAGKRKGVDDPRHLWPFIAEAVRTLRPKWIVLENVRGHVSMGLDVVLRDLAQAGFDAEWCVLRASDVGACHQRARLFIVAADARRAERGAEGGPRDAGGQLVVPGERHEGAAPPLGDQPPAADPGGERHGGGQDPGEVGRVDRGDAGAPRQRERPWEVPGDRSGPVAADADCHNGRGWTEADRLPTPAGAGDQADAVPWGPYEPAVERWATVLGRPAPRPVDERGRLSPRFTEWMMGYPLGWTDGLTRTQALKALGNAVVTQQAAAALAELCPF